MRHQVLIETENLVKECLRFCTNQAYANKVKCAYSVEWKKGEHAILDDRGKKITNYYSLTLVMVDKRESPVGNRIELYRNYYPTEIGVTAEKLEEKAYKEFILNGISSLINVTYAGFVAQKTKVYTNVEDVKLNPAIEDLKDDIDASKPKIITP